MPCIIAQVTDSLTLQDITTAIDDPKLIPDVIVFIYFFERLRHQVPC